MENATTANRGVLGSLSAALRRLRRNTILFAGAFVLVLVGGLVAILSFFEPLLGNVVSILWLLVWPFLIAGLLGMVVETRTGRTDLSTLVSAGKVHYLSMLGATLLFTAIILGVMFLTFILTIVLVFGAIVGVGDLLEGGFTLLLVGVALLFLLPYALVYLFFQFYDVAIVASGERALSSLTHSFDLVRKNVLGVVGYTVVFVVIQAVGYGPGYLVLFLGGMEITETGQWVLVSETYFAIGALLVFVLGTVAMAVAFTYHVVFYESLLSGSEE